VKARVLARKHACILSGLHRSLHHVLHWLSAIVDTDQNVDGKVLFVGADKDGARVGSVAFAPTGFEALTKLFEPPRKLAETYAAQMVCALEAHGWPEWVAAANELRAGSKRSAPPCAHCGLHLTSTWLRDGVCLGCEHTIRRTGRCPFGRVCGPRAWCEHASRCLLCDRWSCAECRFHHGDGTDVAALVASLQPENVYIDFDRTLCSTRGGSPLKGAHSIDEELVGVMSQIGQERAFVVTRNAHVDDIRTFLAQRGLERVEVVRVARPASKAVIVAAKPGLALFVDDTIAEHLDDEMRHAPNVVRFLFARS
jgi:hypothetical protein